MDVSEALIPVLLAAMFLQESLGSLQMPIR